MSLWSIKCLSMFDCLWLQNICSSMSVHWIRDNDNWSKEAGPRSPIQKSHLCQIDNHLDRAYIWLSCIPIIVSLLSLFLLSFTKWLLGLVKQWQDQMLFRWIFYLALKETLDSRSIKINFLGNKKSAAVLATDPGKLTQRSGVGYIRLTWNLIQHRVGSSRSKA